MSIDIPIDQTKAVNVLPYRNEDPLFWISVYLAATLWIFLVIFTFGMIIPIMLFIGLLGWFGHSLLITWIKGNAVKITPEQFPDLHALYLQTCARLGIHKRPELYLAQADGMLNAIATRFMRRDYVVLLSGVVDALEDRPQAIKFYMGHELAHIKRKHLSRHWWLWPAMIYPLLAPAYSRAKEYTCDRYGFASCDNLDDAKRALAVLAAGPERWKTINIAAFESQAQETGGFWMAVNELTADYPWLCKRMMVLENRNAVFPRRNFFAWMIALLSPRMGYGGAVIGFLYWLFLGGFIVFMVLAIAFSSSAMSKPGAFSHNPIIQEIEKIFKIKSGEDEELTRDEAGAAVGEATADAVGPATAAAAEPMDGTKPAVASDEEILIAAYSHVAEVSGAVDVYIDAHKNKAPALLEVLSEKTELDISDIDYEILSKGSAKVAPKLSLVYPVACEQCEAEEAKLELRRDAEGTWGCFTTGIEREVIEKLPLECKAN
jgi:Zn-dependent protease with chaperone function